MLTFEWSDPNEKQNLHPIVVESRTVSVEWYDPNCGGDNPQGQRETLAARVRGSAGDGTHIERCGMGTAPGSKAS